MYLFFNGLLKKGEGGRYTIVILTLIILCVLIISIYIDKVNRDNWMPSGVDAKRISDIRQISLAMEKVYDNEGRYPEITTTTNGRIDIEIIGHLDPVPRDIGYGTVVGCNDIKDAPYRGFNNTSDRSKYCIYACLEKGGFFAASHKGIKLLKKEPNSLDCW
ncbi:hypothetical protein J7K24_01455 [bacterium]|nr:hypothetical protein [bacterium]